jgi:uncharacterized protein YndB with AHSA1/START domain
MPSYDVRVRTAAPKEQVFALLADVTTWPRWAGPMVMAGWWGQEGDPAPGGIGAIRRVGSSRIAAREQITEFDPPNYLAYTILGRSPFRDYRAIVSIDADGDGSRITWAGAWDTVIPGTDRLLAWLLRRMIGGMARGLARYAQTQTGVAS